MKKWFASSQTAFVCLTAAEGSSRSSSSSRRRDKATLVSRISVVGGSLSSPSLFQQIKGRGTVCGGSSCCPCISRRQIVEGETERERKRRRSADERLRDRESRGEAICQETKSRGASAAETLWSLVHGK